MSVRNVRVRSTRSLDGAWTADIPAPNASGDYPVTVHHEIDGEANGEIVVTVAYGAGVAITAPVEGMAHDGGPVTLRGTGEVGAQVTVREEGRSTVLGSAQVLANGQWTIRTTDVDDRKHVLEASQTGKGNNTTTSTVTLNPENGEQPPVIVAPTVETPEAGSTVTTSRPVFSGHGQDGATVTIVQATAGTDGVAAVHPPAATLACREAASRPVLLAACRPPAARPSSSRSSSARLSP